MSIKNGCQFAERVNQPPVIIYPTQPLQKIKGRERGILVGLVQSATLGQKYDRYIVLANN